MRDERDAIIKDAVEALRATAEGLNEQGFGAWAQTNDRIAAELEKRAAACSPEG